jgi:hypothetical protein
MSNNFTGLEVNVDIGGITYTASLEEDIEIDGQDLDAEFLTQARKFAWWAMVSELAKDLMNRRKYDLDQLYARLDHKVRMEASCPPAPAKPIKLTEKMVENSVITSPEYKAAYETYLEIKKYYGMLSAGREAFVQRKEMLISLGANYRAEGNADPVLLQERAKAKASEIARRRSGSGTTPTSKRTPVRKS